MYKFFILLTIIACSNKEQISESKQAAIMKQVNSTTIVDNSKSFPIYPISQITPGAILPEATLDKICVPGYSKTVRNVPESEKQEVMKNYADAIKLSGVEYPSGSYEIDHLISLELGGSNDIKNLWPESYTTKPGAHQKDAVENHLHKEVCDKTIELSRAQQIISTDWYNCYELYVKKQDCK